MVIFYGTPKWYEICGFNYIWEVCIWPILTQWPTNLMGLSSCESAPRPNGFCGAIHIITYPYLGISTRPLTFWLLPTFELLTNRLFFLSFFFKLLRLPLSHRHPPSFSFSLHLIKTRLSLDGFRPHASILFPSLEVSRESLKKSLGYDMPSTSFDIPTWAY